MDKDLFIKFDKIGKFGKIKKRRNASCNSGKCPFRAYVNYDDDTYDGIGNKDADVWILGSEIRYSKEILCNEGKILEACYNHYTGRNLFEVVYYTPIIKCILPIPKDMTYVHIILARNRCIYRLFGEMRRHKIRKIICVGELAQTIDLYSLGLYPDTEIINVCSPDINKESMKDFVTQFRTALCF